MARRKSVYRVKREAAETLPSPNATVPGDHYPPHMGHELTAVRLLGEVAMDATDELLREWGPDAED